MEVKNMNKISICIDCQNDFITGSLGSKEAQAIVPKIVEKIKNEPNETLIIFTQDTHYEDYLDTPEGKKLPIPHCLNKSRGWRINQEIFDAWLDRDIEENLIVPRHNILDNSIFKKTFGSFDLLEVIQDTFYEFEGKCKEIELYGLVLDICVITNALLLKTMFPDIEVTVDVSCCAATSEENYKSAINVLKSCQVNVINEKMEE